MWLDRAYTLDTVRRTVTNKGTIDIEILKARTCTYLGIHTRKGTQIK